MSFSLFFQRREPPKGAKWGVAPPPVGVKRRWPCGLPPTHAYMTNLKKSVKQLFLKNVQRERERERETFFQFLRNPGVVGLGIILT